MNGNNEEKDLCLSVRELARYRKMAQQTPGDIAVACCIKDELLKSLRTVIDTQANLIKHLETALDAAQKVQEATQALEEHHGTHSDQHPVRS